MFGGAPVSDAIAASCQRSQTGHVCHRRHPKAFAVSCIAASARIGHCASETCTMPDWIAEIVSLEIDARDAHLLRSRDVQDETTPDYQRSHHSQPSRPHVNLLAMAFHGRPAQNPSGAGTGRTICAQIDRGHFCWL